MVITRFSLYESNVQNEEYAVCIPSGEVIYLGDVDLNILMLRGLIYKLRSSDEYYRCSDQDARRVNAYVEKQSKPTQSSSRLRIAEFLKECGLLEDQYKILDDLSIDAMGAVNMSYKNLKHIPFKFNRCTSDFICSHNDLITLENAPKSVHGNFNCSFNQLQSLEGGPKNVSRVYDCSNNYLTTLKGAPVRLNFFNCSYNYLTDLRYAPEVSDRFIKNNNIF